MAVQFECLVSAILSDGMALRALLSRNGWSTVQLVSRVLRSKVENPVI